MVSILVSHCWTLFNLDYGCLTFLIADEHAKGSLQVKLPASGEWISADPIEGCFVCNIGDMMQVRPLRLEIDTRFGRIISIARHYIVSFINHLNIECQFRSSSNRTSMQLFLRYRAVLTKMGDKERSRRKLCMEIIF